MTLSLPSTEIIDLPNTPNISARRQLAALLTDRSNYEIYIDAVGKKMSYRQWFTIMLWDLITLGECYFADGRTLKIEESKEWLDVIKMLLTHLDGPMSVNDGNSQNINMIKVYVGINPDRV